VSEANNLRAIATAARDASRVLGRTSGGRRTDALRAIARALRDQRSTILEANARDVERAREHGLADAFIDRLMLNPNRVEAMARAVDEIASQDDPLGRIESTSIRPNGLQVGRMRCPLGVIAVIYEARPNVTSDAAALSLRTGNAILLKGGRDASASNHAIGEIIQAALRASELPSASVQVITSEDRASIAELLTYDDLIDVAIPRGGEGLIRFVSEHARVPVIKHYKGVCHVYLHEDAEIERSIALVVNAKVSRPSVCNALECLLVHAAAAPRLLPAIAKALREHEVTIHGCDRTVEVLGTSTPVNLCEEWGTEYLSLDIAIRVVDDLGAAIDHIDTFGSGHTEAIISDSVAATRRFVNEVQSSCVMVNASTRFADGGELGLGAEIGISTSKLHAYGPMGAEGLTTTRFVVSGDGHIR